MTYPSISAVLPAYNEELCIVSSLEKIERYLANSGSAWELVVVDDGSADGTGNLVDEYILRSPNSEQIQILRNGVNRGKGCSVRRGFLAAKCDVVLFTDSDLSAPIEEAEKLLSPIRENRCDAVFGSRALAGSQIHVHQPIFRELGGKCFNLLMRLIAGLPYSDTQCGFKAFRREAFVPVFQRQRIERFGFDVEILYLAHKRGLRLAEVPVVWSHCEDTKIHFLRDSVTMFLDLWRIRCNDWLKRYD